MPSYLTSVALWEALWPIPLAATLIAALLLLALHPRANRRSYFLVLLSFGILGMVTGLMAGFSRQPAMGAVLPAVLSLVGALAIYLIGAEKADQALVGVCVIALSLNLLVGSMWGAVLRDDFERDPVSAAAKKREALIEVDVRDFRRELGLPDYPPTPPAKNEETSSVGAPQK
jgi:uncharacterized membrane protein YhaH (DUF805 family)